MNAVPVSKNSSPQEFSSLDEMAATTSYQTALDWIARNEGTNVARTCDDSYQAARADGKEASLDRILGELKAATRAIDLSKNNFRAKFR